MCQLWRGWPRQPYPADRVVAPTQLEPAPTEVGVCRPCRPAPTMDASKHAANLSLPRRNDGDLLVAHAALPGSPDEEE